VARPPLRGNRVRLAMGILFTCWSIYWILTQFRNWTVRAEFFAFYAGAGGGMLMFYRWRRHGDTLAKVLCLSAFGMWALGVVTWGVGGADAGKPGSMGFDIAAAALLTGFVGAIVVLIRIYIQQNRNSNVQPQKSEQAT
jgi:hypothetical protein